MNRSLFCVCAATACAVGPDFVRPAPPAGQAYVGEPAEGKSSRFDVSRRLPADWWRLFGCAPLDAAVRDALANNAGLQASEATLRRSQHLMRAGAGVFYPQLDARAAASRQRYNPAPDTLPASTFNLFTLSGTITYTLDLWGGQRRAVESLAAQVDAARYTLAGAQVMLVANVADAIFARAAYVAEREAIEASLNLVAQQRRIAEAQARAGTAPYANVIAVDSQLAAMEALLPPLDQKIDQAGHLLAVLLGRAPPISGLPPVALDAVLLPKDLPLTLPSDLVRERPDILVAEAQLHAANAAIGVATAAMLPNITLSGSFGSNATSTGSLFAANSPVWNLAAGLTAPIFHGGTLAEERSAAIETREASAALYRQTVLEAFAQVADALRAIEHDGDLLAAQEKAVRASRETVRLLQANYQAGVATYLQVLAADVLLLQAQVGYAQAVGQRLQDTVALYAALGGGWWNASSRGEP